MTETRYQREKERKNSIRRFNTISGRLAEGFVEAFRAELDKDESRPCRKADGTKPNPWYDWHSDPEVREDYETEPPTRADAYNMCRECPFFRADGPRSSKIDGPCYDYARATRQTHGVWGGVRLEDGKVIQD